MSNKNTPLSGPPQARRSLVPRSPRTRLAGGVGALLATSALVAGSALATSSAAATPQASGSLYDGSAGLAAGQMPFVHQSFVSPHVTVVPDPLGGNFNVMKFAIADSDRPYSGASNPRGDFRTPSLYGNGSSLYTSIKFMEPAGFPAMKGGNGFFQIGEIYGQPYGGSPAIGIGLFPGAGGRPSIALTRDASHGYDNPWKGPTLDTGWHTLYLHTVMSTSESGGSVQIWFDGKPQTFSNGSQTLTYRTLGPSNWNGTANFLNVNQYRRAGAYPGTVTTYQAAAKVGTTLAAVQDGNPTTTTTTPTTTTTTTPTTTTTTSTTPAPPPSALVARFTGPSSSVTGRTVTFDGAGSTGSPVKYLWKDGKTTLGTSKSLTFTFHYVGVKHLMLTVTSASGKTASVQHDVSVTQPPVAAAARTLRALRHHRRHMARQHHRQHRHHHRHHRHVSQRAHRG